MYQQGSKTMFTSGEPNGSANAALKDTFDIVTHSSLPLCDLLAVRLMIAYLCALHDRHSDFMVASLTLT